jgi:hypothetical protein
MTLVGVPDTREGVKPAESWLLTWWMGERVEYTAKARTGTRENNREGRHKETSLGMENMVVRMRV